jgi:hypothetical protein
MAELPFDLVEKIADMADIDTRRHMGFPPRKLCTHRLKAMEYKIRHRLSMQYRSVESSCFWCSTILPVNNILLYIFYSVSLEKIYFSAIVIKQLDRITIDDASIRWISSYDHAVHVNNLFTEKQNIYTTSFAIMDYRVCLTSENINAIRQAMPT